MAQITPNSPNSSSPQPDLDNCAKEPIHLLGRVQSFGCLIAISSDWEITNYSENAQAMLELEEAFESGRPLAHYLGRETLHTLRSRMQMIANPNTVERIFGIALEGKSTRFDVAVHAAGNRVVLEFERSQTSQNSEYNSYVQPMIARAEETTSLEQLHSLAARQIKMLTGMDRVMIYRFLPDDTGEVIAEALNPEMAPFMGLRYPATDIPKQARSLYLRNRLRIISDVNDPGQLILPIPENDETPLDLSLSTTRAVSPVHIEYLRNMNVAASMSISIIIRGRLWGLIACHHGEPLVLSYKLRTACELFAQLFAYTLDQKLSDADREQNERFRKLHRRVRHELAEKGTTQHSFETIADAVAEVISFDGIAAVIDGEVVKRGVTPKSEQVWSLAQHLSRQGLEEVLATDLLSEEFPEAAEYVEVAAGMIAVPLSVDPSNYLMLFRREVARTVDWAGDPSKPAVETDHGQRISPRKSFELWQQLVRMQSTPWAEWETEAAEIVRTTVLEFIMRSAPSKSASVPAAPSQEVLIAELNHRVRNILNLITGLVNQTAQGTRDVSDFADQLGGRIQALARAHDQLTQKQMASASLRDLIATEAQAFLPDNAARLEISGPDIRLRPQAYSTFALLIHELMTNALKYGALSASDGNVRILIQSSADGMWLGWEETGGPAVKQPSRKGFGTTIIEHSVPFELKGDAQIDYRETGLAARFFVPPVYIVETLPEGAEKDPQEAKVANEGRPFAVRVLLVEDNLIIGMDAESSLKALGAQEVRIARSCQDGLQIARDWSFDFALLDVNLGSETSEPVARILRDGNVPFAFATGYGELTGLSEAFAGVPIIQKPYDMRAVSAAYQSSSTA